MRGLRDERGGVIVLAAVMIPVFLLLTAVVIDAGNWFTHKRQLQNRADAAALAAGIEYAKNWRPCVQTADVALKLKTAQVIANAARQFAADPEAADYSDLDPLASPPTSLYNDQIARQDPDPTKNYVDVVINSGNNDYSDDQDYTDDNDGNAATKIGHPCFDHNFGDPEGLSATPGHWTDVKVTERDTAALWEPFSPDLHARARIEIRPALSGNGYLPLAIPNNVIEKVQIRYYDYCLDPTFSGTPLAKENLKPLPAADQTEYAKIGGGTLWGLQSLATPSEGDKDRSIPIVINPYDPVDCGPTGLQYRPIVVQVRLSARSEIDIDGACSTLAASPFADCFSRISQIRVYETGGPGTQPRVRDVRLNGGCSPLGDAYFGPIPPTADPQECAFGAEVYVDWGSRADDELADSTKFSVKVNGVALDPPGPTTPTGTWTTAGSVLTAVPGPNAVHVEVDWKDETPSRTWDGVGQCKSGGGNPCKWNGPAEEAHLTFAGTPEKSGAVELVRSSISSFSLGLPSSPFDNTPGGTVQIFPTVATRSVLKTGILTTLRLNDPQANQTLECDPNVAQGQEFQTFRDGCQPFYGPNTFKDGLWWDTTTRKCPPKSVFFSYADLGGGYGLNSAGNFWQCVPTAPGLSPPVIGNGMAVATDNCSDIKSNSCAKTDCLVDGNYDGKPSPLTPGDPGWLYRGDAGLGSGDPRVVNLFIVPYQALKNSKGADPEETVPVLGLASFYVMNWTGANPADSDPCPDTTFGSVVVPDPPKGGAVGVFIEAVEFETGPVDPNATCYEGQLTPCRAQLVR